MASMRALILLLMNKFVIKLKKGYNDHIQSQRIHERSQTQTLQHPPTSQRTVQLYKHINDLSPYAVHDQQNELESKIQNICKLHLNLKQYRTMRFKTEHSPKRKTFGQRDIQKIVDIKWQKKYNRQFRSQIKQMQKKLQEKQQERQIAQQMIYNIKNDRKQYKHMRQNIQTKIRRFQNDLIINDDNFKFLIREHREGNKQVERIFDNHQQERNLYADRTGYINRLLKVNKRDYFQFARPNSTKLINLNEYTAKPRAWLTPEKDSKKNSLNYANTYFKKYQKPSLSAKKNSL